MASFSAESERSSSRSSNPTEHRWKISRFRAALSLRAKEERRSALPTLLFLDEASNRRPAAGPMRGSVHSDYRRTGIDEPGVSGSF